MKTIDRILDRIEPFINILIPLAGALVVLYVIQSLF